MVDRQDQGAASRKGATGKHWQFSIARWHDCHSKGRMKLIKQPAAIMIVPTTSGYCHGISPWCSKAEKTTMAKASSGCSIDKFTAIKNNLNKEKQQSNGKQQQWQWYASGNSSGAGNTVAQGAAQVVMATAVAAALAKWHQNRKHRKTAINGRN